MAEAEPASSLHADGGVGVHEAGLGPSLLRISSAFCVRDARPEGRERGGPPAPPFTAR